MKSLFLIIALICMVGFPRAAAQRNGGVRIHFNLHPVQVLTVHEHPKIVENHKIALSENVLNGRAVKNAVNDALVKIYSRTPHHLAVIKTADTAYPLEEGNRVTQILYAIEVK